MNRSRPARLAGVLLGDGVALLLLTKFKSEVLTSGRRERGREERVKQPMRSSQAMMQQRGMKKTN